MDKKVVWQYQTNPGENRQNQTSDGNEVQPENVQQPLLSCKMFTKSKHPDFVKYSKENNTKGSNRNTISLKSPFFQGKNTL